MTPPAAAESMAKALEDAQPRRYHAGCGSLASGGRALGDACILIVRT